MAGADRMTIEEVVKQVLLDADVIREAVKAVCAELMEVECQRRSVPSAVSGASMTG